MPTTGGAQRSDAVRLLRELIEQEIERPRPFEQLAADLPRITPDAPLLGRTLGALARADRKRFWVKAESLWFSRFGWRLIRPMMAVGLLAAAGYFFFGSSVNRSEHLLHFFCGIAAFYVVLQLYAHLWARQDEKKLAQSERELNDELEQILEELRRP